MTEDKNLDGNSSKAHVYLWLDVFRFVSCVIWALLQSCLMPAFLIHHGLGGMTSFLVL